MTKWISVKEKLPMKWGMYLVCYRRIAPYEKIDTQVLHFNRVKFGMEYTDDEPLYWMCIPAIPEQEE